MEKREEQGKITLSTMKKIADAIDCQFIYAFIPKNEIKKVLFEQAYKKATKLIKNADVHMTLEDQKVIEEDMEARIKRLAHELVLSGDIW